MLPNPEQVKQLQAGLVANWLKLREQGVQVSPAMREFGAMRGPDGRYIPNGVGVCIVGGDMLGESAVESICRDFATKHNLDVDWAFTFANGTDTTKEYDPDDFDEAGAMLAGREAALAARKAIGLE